MSRFFVTLNHPNGGVVPLVDENDAVCTFKTHGEAEQAINDNMIGHHYGGRIYDTENDGEDA